jgi:integrase
MTEEDKKPAKKPRLKRPAVEPGIYPNLDKAGNPDGTFDVKVSRRMWMSESNPHGQMFRRKRRVNGIVAAQRQKKKFFDELAMEALRHEGKDIKWRVALDTYYDYLKRRQKENTISYSTIESTMTTLEKHTKKWQDKWLSDFKTSMIEDFIFSAELKAEIGHATRINLLKYIRGVFNRQVAQGRISHNPVLGMTVRKSGKPSYPKWFTKEQMGTLIAHAEVHDPRWAEIYKAAYWSGARSGELYSLRWSDYRTEQNTKVLHIRKTYCWKSETEKETKGRQDRTVVVSKLFEAFLAELKLKNPTSEYILPRLPDWRNGKAAVRIREHLKAIRIDPKGYKFHSIRATFITNLLLDGVPVIKIQNMVGHQDLKTLFFYVGMIGDHLKGSTDSLTLDKPKVVSLDEFKDKKQTS